MKTVNAKDQTPLHLAAGHSGAVTRILLSKGANVHADDKVFCFFFFLSMFINRCLRMEISLFTMLLATTMERPSKLW